MKWCSPNAQIRAQKGGLFRASVDRVTELEAHIDVFDPGRRLRLITYLHSLFHRLTIPSSMTSSSTPIPRSLERFSGCWGRVFRQPKSGTGSISGCGWVGSRR